VLEGSIGSLYSTPLVLVLYELVAVDLELMGHLLPDGITARSSSHVLFEGDVCLVASVFPLAFGKVSMNMQICRYLIDEFRWEANNFWTLQNYDF